MSSRDTDAKYKEALKLAREMLKGLPSDELLVAAVSGMDLVVTELSELIERLGQRQRDIDEALSMARSMETLYKKLKKMADRLAPEVEES